MGIRMIMTSTIDTSRTAEFERDFATVRQRVASVEGHIREDLLRDADDEGTYLVVSEWETRRQFLEWLNSDSHTTMTAELHKYFMQPSKIRFYEIALPIDFDERQVPLRDGSAWGDDECAS